MRMFMSFMPFIASATTTTSTGTVILWLKVFLGNWPYINYFSGNK